MPNDDELGIGSVFAQQPLNDDKSIGEPCMTRGDNPVMRRAARAGISLRNLLAGAALAIGLAVPGHASARVADGINQLAAQIVERSASADRTTIAISSFPHVDDSCSELSNFLVDELVLSLFSLPDNHLSIIERSQLGRIFAELELSMSGAVDINTTRELGRIHGVETLLVGTLTTIGDDLRINARLIDTETAQVFSAAAVNIPRTSTIEELMSRPAAGGCTMMQASSGTGSASPGPSQAAASGGLTLSAGDLESFDELLGEWFGMMECDGQFEEIWFHATEALANGVTGAFRRSRFGGWGRGIEVGGSGGASLSYGSASVTLNLHAEKEGVWLRMVAQQNQGRDSKFSDTFMLQLLGNSSLYGTAASDACNEVNLGRRQAPVDAN